MNHDEFMLYEDEWLETTPSPATENKQVFEVTGSQRIFADMPESCCVFV